jgi:hypothetical protein
MITNQLIDSGKGPKVAIQSHYGPLEVVGVDISRWEATFRSQNSDGVHGPEFTTRLSTIRPLSDEDTEVFWRMLVDDLMHRLRAEGKVPDFVKGYEVTSDEDSTGDPALYVRILVFPQKSYADKTVAEWNDFTDLVQSKLISLRLQLYPYVQIGEMHRRK